MLYSKSNNGFYSLEIHGSATPADAVEISDAAYKALLEGQALGLSIGADAAGFPVLVQPPPPTPEQIQASFTAAIQRRLDAFAKTRNYDGILSACTYANDPDPQLQAEGQLCVNLRSATWRTGYAILAEVLSGARHMPNGIDSIADELPALVWPQAPAGDGVQP